MGLILQFDSVVAVCYMENVVVKITFFQIS